MTVRYANRVGESTTTTGTGAVTLAGALIGFRTWGSIFSNGDTGYYLLQGVDASGNSTAIWEVGYGTWGTGGILTRTTVLDGSSGAGTPVTLTGTSYVFLTLSASQTPQIGPDNGITLPTAGTNAPLTPAANTLQFFARQVANRGMLAYIGPSGLDTACQPFIARNKVGYWNPPGGATTAPGVWGLPALTAAGTATTRTPAATNLATRMRRIGYPSSSTAGTFGGYRFVAAFFTCGSGTPSDGSGFHYVVRWVESDPATVSGRRAFIGMANSTSAYSNVEVNTLTQHVGIMQLSTDATQWYWYGAGSSAAGTQTAVGTGIGAPAGNSTTAWELSIFCPSSALRTYYMQLTNLSTGVVATTTISGTAVQVPDSTIFLAPRHDLTNNATALAAGMDLCSLYIETDF
jgi:hypothetical protein